MSQQTKKIPGVNEPYMKAFDFADARAKNKYLLVRVKGSNMSYKVPDTFADKFSATWKTKMDKTKARRLSMPLQKDQPGHVELPYFISDTHSMPAIKFVMGWILAGGMDPTGEGAVQYPSDNLKGLESLLKLINELAIGPLRNRVEPDVKALKETSKQRQLGPLPSKPRKKVVKKTVHCHNCLSDKHVAKNCPIPYHGRHDHGFLLYTPPKIKLGSPDGEDAPEAAAEKVTSETDSKEADPIVTKIDKHVEVSESRHAYMMVRDQDGNQWLLPLKTCDIIVNGIDKDGRVKFSGSAPLEYSSYEEEDFNRKYSKTYGITSGAKIGAVVKQDDENKKKELN